MNNKFSLNTRFKTVDGDDDKFIYIEGIASTSTIDRHNDIIPKSVWTKGVIDRFMDNPQLMDGHDHGKTIGGVTDITSTDSGLRVRAKFYKTWSKAELVTDGFLKTLSIGFRTAWENWESSTDNKTWTANKIDDLLEVSIVAVPANTGASFSIAKALDGDYEDFKKRHINKKEMDFKAGFKAFLAKFKSGDATEEEKTELKGLMEEAKGFLDEAPEKTAEEIEAEKKAAEPKEADEKGVKEKAEKESKDKDKDTKSDSEKSLEAKVKELQTALDKKNAKPTETDKTKDGDINGSYGLSDEEKRLNANAAFINKNINKWKRS